MSLYSVLRDECLMKNVCIEIGAASSVWQLCKPLVHASSSVCQSGGNNKPTREGFYAQGSLCLRSKFLGGDKSLTLSHMQLNPPSSQRLKQKLATRCTFYPEPSCPVLDLRTPTFLSSKWIWKSELRKLIIIKILTVSMGSLIGLAIILQIL